MSKFIALIITISLSIITVIADWFIKKASFQNNVWNKWLILGGVVYGLTAIGWVFVMKNMKLFTIGAIYGISCTALLAIISIFIFHEKINTIEIFGIFMGIISIAILYRFT